MSDENNTEADSEFTFTHTGPIDEGKVKDYIVYLKRRGDTYNRAVHVARRDVALLKAQQDRDSEALAARDREIAKLRAVGRLPTATAICEDIAAIGERIREFIALNRAANVKLGLIPEGPAAREIQQALVRLVGPFQLCAGCGGHPFWCVACSDKRMASAVDVLRAIDATQGAARAIIDAADRRRLQDPR